MFKQLLVDKSFIHPKVFLHGNKVIACIKAVLSIVPRTLFMSSEIRMYPQTPLICLSELIPIGPASQNSKSIYKFTKPFLYPFDKVIRMPSQPILLYPKIYLLKLSDRFHLPTESYIHPSVIVMLCAVFQLLNAHLYLYKSYGDLNRGHREGL